MGQAARRQKVRESARESVRAQHTIERASSSSVALSLLLLPLLCLVLYMCVVRVCVFECALRAKLIFLFIKKKSKYICIFVCCAAFFFSAPPPLAFFPYRALNIIFVAAAKNIIYVLFMIFYDFPLFPIGIFYLPETCLIYTQRHLGTHSSPIWRRPGRGHRPGPGPRRTLEASLYRLTFEFHFGFGIGLRFGESSPAQFGVLHLPLTYFILGLIYTRDSDKD